MNAKKHEKDAQYQSSEKCKLKSRRDRTTATVKKTDNTKFDKEMEHLEAPHGASENENKQYSHIRKEWT